MQSTFSYPQTYRAKAFHRWMLGLGAGSALFLVLFPLATEKLGFSDFGMADSPIFLAFTAALALACLVGVLKAVKGETLTIGRNHLVITGLSSTTIARSDITGLVISYDDGLSLVITTHSSLPRSVPLVFDISPERLLERLDSWRGVSPEPRRPATPDPTLQEVPVGDWQKRAVEAIDQKVAENHMPTRIQSFGKRRSD